MNRQERREQIRKYAKFKDSEPCPLCNKKSRFISIPTKDYLCDIKCELCNGIVYKDVAGVGDAQVYHRPTLGMLFPVRCPHEVFPRQFPVGSIFAVGNMYRHCHRRNHGR